MYKTFTLCVVTATVGVLSAGGSEIAKQGAAAMTKKYNVLIWDNHGTIMKAKNPSFIG